MLLCVSLIYPIFVLFFQCVTLGVKCNRRRTRKQRNAAKKTKRMPLQQPWTCFFFCKEGQHSYKACPVRKTWLASRKVLVFLNFQINFLVHLENYSFVLHILF
jgi:hypothetical protein